MKRIGVATILVLILIGTLCIWKIYSKQSNYLQAALTFAHPGVHVSSLHNKYGPPTYIYTEFPPPLGKSLLTEAEDVPDKVEIQCFLLQERPPVFLVVKVDRVTRLVISSVLEGS